MNTCTAHSPLYGLEKKELLHLREVGAGEGPNIDIRREWRRGDMRGEEAEAVACRSVLCV